MIIGNILNGSKRDTNSSTEMDSLGLSQHVIIAENEGNKTLYHIMSSWI